MGKKQRLKKEKKLQEVTQEKEQVKNRYAEMMQPTYKYVRKAVITFILTIALLYIGVFVNQHLHEITKKLIGMN